LHVKQKSALPPFVTQNLEEYGIYAGRFRAGNLGGEKVQTVISRITDHPLWKVFNQIGKKCAAAGIEPTDESQTLDMEADQVQREVVEQLTRDS
jgi:hypothetical protein